MYTVNTVEGKYLSEASQGFTAKSEIRYVTRFVFINIIVSAAIKVAVTHLAHARQWKPSSNHKMSTSGLWLPMT